MNMTPDTTVADIAREVPAAIPVFQAHEIDFCCGGKIPLATACADHQLDVNALLAELNAAAQTPVDSRTDWSNAPLPALIAHIQATYHEPLRVELRRLDAMMTKVADRHGAHLPDTILPLQRTFIALRDELLVHMETEDSVLFPFIAAAESGRGSAATLAMPIDVMEHEHDRAGEALAEMRGLTRGYAPPEWACPTFRGLYYGLAQFEATMHVHVHLENNILFPRALELARA
jgi:regulator of cell morphogenesis and NO signaling